MVKKKQKARLLAANKTAEVESTGSFAPISFVTVECGARDYAHATQDSYCYNTPTSCPPCKMLSSHFYFSCHVVNDSATVNQPLFFPLNPFFFHSHASVKRLLKREAGIYVYNCTVCREISPQAFLNYRWKQSIYCIAIFRKDIFDVKMCIYVAIFQN